MSENEPKNKIKKKDEKLCPLKCAVSYANQLPDPAISCKFLPCGKTLMEFTEEPVSFPQLETRFNYNFKGLHLLFDMDLINQNTYTQVAANPNDLDIRDVELLADIDALHINNAQVKGSHSFPTRAQECRELFAKDRSAAQRQRAGLQRLQPETEQLELESFGLEQQKQIIQQTFIDIAKPLGAHPTKSDSKARPIAQMPLFPEANYSLNDLVHVHYGIPPSGDSSGLLKDCGNHYVNFRLKSNPIFQQIQAAQEQQKQKVEALVSEQRYKEERTAETNERGERFMLREVEGNFYYQVVSKHLKLRKERPSPNSAGNVCLLVKQTNDIPQKPNSGKKT